MTDKNFSKKLEDIEIGQRIKDIRASKKMDQKSFAKKIGSTVSALSNWENGRNKPNDIMLRQIAHEGNISVQYLLNGEPTAKERLKISIDSLKKQLEEENEDIARITSMIDKLEKEEKQYSINSDIKFSDTYLSDILGISSPTKEIAEYYENQLEELYKKRISAISSRDISLNLLSEYENTLMKLENGEIFSLSDRNNPEFEEHGISQFQISENLKTVPYLLNYESTMKIVEYAQMLMEKEENLFKPNI